jgi:hypothetical protein
MHSWLACRRFCRSAGTPVASASPTASFLSGSPPHPQKLYALFFAAANAAAASSSEGARSSGIASAQITPRKDEPRACLPTCYGLQPQASAIRLLNRGRLELAVAVAAAAAAVEPRCTFSPRVAANDDAGIRGSFGGDTCSSPAGRSGELWLDADSELAPWTAVGPESHTASTCRPSTSAVVHRPGIAAAPSCQCGDDDASYDCVPYGVADRDVAEGAAQSAPAPSALLLEGCTQPPLSSSPPPLGKAVLHGSVVAPLPPALLASGSCEGESNPAGESQTHMQQELISAPLTLSQLQLGPGSQRRRLTWTEAVPAELPSCLTVVGTEQPNGVVGGGAGSRCRCVGSPSHL